MKISFVMDAVGTADSLTTGECTTSTRSIHAWLDQKAHKTKWRWAVDACGKFAAH